MIKKGIAFLALFTYLYPVALVFLPLDTGRILHLIGIMYVVLYKAGKIDKKNFRIFLYTIPLVVMGIAATAIYNDAYDFSLLLKVIAIFLYSFSAIMVVDLIADASKSFSVYTVFEWIVYAAVVQAILSLILFVNPDLMDLYVSLVKQSEMIGDIMQTQSAFRLIAVAKSQYANMAVMYGFALLFAIALVFSGKSHFYRHKLFFYLSLLIIFIAGILSARTFFLILLWVSCYFIYLLWRKKGRKVIFYVGIISGCAIGLFFLSMSLLENSEYENTYKWAFEWYINLSESGTLETASTDKLQTMYIFPDNAKTWLFGDGQMHTEQGGFYMNTDVGYLRNIFYWGVAGAFMIYFVQCLYCKTVMKATNLPIMKSLCFFIILWVFAYNVKEFWFADMYWALLLATFIKSRVIKEKQIEGI